METCSHGRHSRSLFVGLFVSIFVFSLASAQNGVPDLSGVWIATPQGGGGGMRARPRITAAAREVMDEFDLLVDDPGYECSPSSLSRVWGNPTPSEIEQLDDRVILRHEFMDVVRTIYLDMGDVPADRLPNVVGHSMGRYEGRSLVVETTGFAKSYISPINGIPQTENLSAVEQLTLSEDGGILEVQLTYSDLTTFEVPWVITRTYRRAPDIELLEYGCVLEDAGYKDFNP